MSHVCPRRRAARLWRIEVRPHGVVIEGIASDAELTRLIYRLGRRGYCSLAYTRSSRDGGRLIRATFSLPPPQTLPGVPDI